MGMTAAEKSFRVKVASATGAKDWPRVAKTYKQYGTYLMLIGGDTPVAEDGGHVIIIWPMPGAEAAESISMENMKGPGRTQFS